MFRFGSRTFAELWTGDVEYRPRPGERPAPLVLVAPELLSGRRLEVFGDESILADWRAHVTV